MLNELNEPVARFRGNVRNLYTFLQCLVTVQGGEGGRTTKQYTHLFCF